MRILIFVLLATSLVGCQKENPTLTPGNWRGVLELQGQQLPFTFEVRDQDGKTSAYLINDTEKILLDELVWENDSLKIVLHIFDAELRVRVQDNELTGFYYKNYDPSFKAPFTALYNQSFRFAPNESTASVDYSGKYAVQFYTPLGDTIPSVGIFQQQGNQVTGTFLTPTGDYRYLEGNVVSDKLYLSTFDGNHAFLFVASKAGNTLAGDFWSGSASHETWVAQLDSTAALPNAESLTYLKEGYDEITFTFPDVNRKNVSLPTDEYRGKVVILQIFGTWCPNCMDETKFLSQWYNENKDRGVEIIGLAYERKDDFDYASTRIKKMVGKLDVKYTFLVAGTNDKEKASESLPMLNRVMAFPTTIFIGKDGKVKHIRTGFEGPGTGIYYEQFKERFNSVVNELLAEKNPS